MTVVAIVHVDGSSVVAPDLMRGDPVPVTSSWSSAGPRTCPDSAPCALADRWVKYSAPRRRPCRSPASSPAGRRYGLPTIPPFIGGRGPLRAPHAWPEPRARSRSSDLRLAATLGLCSCPSTWGWSSASAISSRAYAAPHGRRDLPGAERRGRARPPASCSAGATARR